MITTFNIKRNIIKSGSKHSELIIEPNLSSIGKNNSVVLDNSENNNQIITQGNNSQGILSPYLPHWSVYFDGVGDKVTSPNIATSLVINVSENFTIDFWIRFENPGRAAMILDCRPTTTTSNGLNIYINTSGSIILSRGTSTILSSNINTIQYFRWQHVALVRENDRISWYIDGFRDIFIDSNVSFNASAFSIGSKNYLSSSTPDFKGYLSNFRIIRSFAAYSGSAFTVPVNNSTVRNNTEFLSLQSNRFVDNSGNSIIFNIGGNPKISTNNPFKKEITLSTPTTLTKDTSVYSLNNSAYFEGFGDSLAFDYNESFNLTTLKNWTVELWCYLNIDNFSRRRLVGNMPSSTESGWALDISQNRNIIFYMSNNVPLQTSQTLSLNKWYHICITRDNATVKIYIDGVEVLTNNIVDGNNNANPLQIGTSAEPYNYLGYMSNLRINFTSTLYEYDFTPSLTPLLPVPGTTLLTLQNQYFADNSTFNRPYYTFRNIRMTTAGPFTSVYDISRLPGSNYFDNSDISTTVTSNFDFGVNDFTIEFWVNLEQQSSGFSYLIFGTKENENNGLFIGFDSSNRLTISLDTSTSSSIYSSITTLQSTFLNRWTHLALTRESGTVKIFLNGSEITLLTHNNTISINNIKISTGNNIKGYISDLRVTKNIAIYSKNFVLQDSYFKTNNSTALHLKFNNYNLIDNSKSTNLQMRDVDMLNLNDQAVMYFNGITSKVIVPKNIAPQKDQSFTLDIWINPNNIGATQFIIGVRSPGQNIEWSIMLINGSLEFKIGDATHTHTSIILNTGTWYLVSLVTKNNIMYCFLDGVLLIAKTISVYYQIGDYTVLGSANNDLNPFNGYIGKCRILQGVAMYTKNHAITYV